MLYPRCSTKKFALHNGPQAGGAPRPCQHVSSLRGCYIGMSMSAPDSLFVRTIKAQAAERTPVWFMRQAGRYMPEYRAIRKSYSLIEICKKPEIAAQVT